MNGYDHFSSTVSMAKQLLMECQSQGMITLPKETVKLLCEALNSQWTGRQQAVSAEFPKVK